MKRLVCTLLIVAGIIPCAIAQQKSPAPPKQGISAHKKTIVPSSKTGFSDEDIRTAFQAKEYQKALDMADTRSKEHPGNTIDLGIKALCYGMLHEKEKVKQCLIAMNPHHPDSIGIYLATFPGNLPKEAVAPDAVWYFNEARKLIPNSAIPYLMESAVMLDDSLTDKAKTAALKGYPLLKETDGVEMRIQYCKLLSACGATAEGAALLDHMVKTHPEDTTVVSEHYASLLRENKYAEGMQELNHLIRLQPQYNKPLRKERAFLYKDMGKGEEACAEAASLAAEDDNYFFLQTRMGCMGVFADLKPSSVKSYTYNVDYHGSKYQFIVTPKNIHMNESSSFSWAMTAPASLSGSIQMSKMALDTARTQMNTFQGGAVDLDRTTSVWISSAVFRDLKTTGITRMNTSGNGLKRFQLIEENMDEPVITNAKGQKKALRSIHVRSEDGKEELWINDDPANPLITQMSIGWTIDLISVQ